jgi:hypothetical protein
MSGTANNAKTATVAVLTAEVRVLMVGSRQVTLSVYRQLDRVDPMEIEIEAFGRVSDSYDEKWARELEYGHMVFVIGREPETGALVRSYREWATPWSVAINDLVVTAQWGQLPRHINVDGRKAEVHAPALEGWKSCNGTAVWIPEDGGSWGCTERGSVGLVKEGAKCKEWHFTSPEAEAEAEHRVRAMRARVETERQAFADWEDLPLIVLAGLR